MKAFKTIIGAALAAVLLQVPVAHAEEDDLPIGTAESKNLVQRTVTIDDQLFRVTDRTEILDLAGRPMRFEQVVTAADLGDTIELDRITYAYDAHDDVLALLKSVPVPR